MMNFTGGNIIQSEHSDSIGKKLYLNSDTADVFFSFAIGDKKMVRVPAHKTFLENGSSVFKSMFCGGIREEGDVKIPDASVDGFKEFLQFFYLGGVQLTIENIAEVMYLAEKYDVIECMKVCERFIQIHLSELDLLNAFEVAILFKRNELKAFLETKISEQPSTVFNLDAFKKCSRDTLKSILSIKNLDCEPFDVFNVCIDWAKTACTLKNKDISTDNLRVELGDCFELIPFDSMQPFELSEAVAKHRGFFDREELEDIIEIFGPNKTPLFRKLKPKSYFVQWNDNAILNCNCLAKAATQRFYYINKTENISFRVDKKMLFGGIEIIQIQRNFGNFSNFTNSLNGVLMIIENESSINSKILLKQPIELEYVQKSPIKFREVVMVRPNCVYDLQIVFNKDWAEMKYFTDTSAIVPSVSLNGNQAITFVEYEFLNSPIVSNLRFNAYNKHKIVEKKWNKSLIIIGASIAIGCIYLYKSNRLSVSEVPISQNLTTNVTDPTSIHFLVNELISILDRFK